MCVSYLKREVKLQTAKRGPPFSHRQAKQQPSSPANSKKRNPPGNRASQWDEGIEVVLVTSREVKISREVCDWLMPGRMRGMLFTPTFFF